MQPAMMAFVACLIPGVIALIIWVEDGHKEIEYTNMQSKEYGESFQVLIASLIFALISIGLLRYGLRYSKAKTYETITHAS